MVSKVQAELLYDVIEDMKEQGKLVLLVHEAIQAASARYFSASYCMVVHHTSYWSYTLKPMSPYPMFRLTGLVAGSATWQRIESNSFQRNHAKVGFQQYRQSLRRASSKTYISLYDPQAQDEDAWPPRRHERGVTVYTTKRPTVAFEKLKAACTQLPL